MTSKRHSPFDGRDRAKGGTLGLGEEKVAPPAHETGSFCSSEE